MMYWTVNWSVKFRRIIVVVAAGLLLYGMVQLDDVKQDLLPEFSPTTVEVQTEALGLSAAEVEQLITVPLEQDLLNGVAFLAKIESASLPGLSSVVMTFEPGTALLDARQVVAERLTQAAGLPQVAAPPQMLQPLSSTSRVAMVSLSSTEIDPIEMSVLARWVMVPRLLGVEGVANVSIWGFRDQQLQVLVDPVRLSKENVTLSQVIATTGNALEVSPLSFLEASSPGTGGFIDTTNQRLHIFHEQAISTPEQLAQVTIEGPDGGAVFVAGEAVALGDVTDIVVDHQPLIGDAVCSGGPCVLLVIEKFPEENTPQVAAGIDDALDALSLGLPGIDVDSSIYRPAAFIDSSMSNLRGTLIVGAVLLLLVVGVMFLSWRIALIGIATIVTSLVAAGLVLFAFDVTVNAMIVAGLVAALVVIIDDAIIGAWGSARDARTDAPDETHVISGIIDSTLRMRTVALYAAVIMAAAVLPVFVMAGEADAFLKPIVQAYLLAVAAALVVSITVAPALSVLLLEGHVNLSGHTRFTGWLTGWYAGFAARFIAKTTALIVFGVFAIAGVVALLFINVSLRPELNERDIVVQIEAAPGTALPRMVAITEQLVDDLKTQPGIANVSAHIGRAVRSDKVVNVNSAEVWINVDPRADYDATLTAIDSVVGDANDVRAVVATYSDQRVSAVLDRTDDELVVRVYGENPLIRQDAAEQIQAAMREVDGVDEPRIAVAVVEPTIEIEVDLQRAQAFGVKPGDVRRQAATLVSGLVVGNLFEDQKVFDVVVWGTPGIRETVDDVRALAIATPSGDDVALADLADVRVVPNRTVIRREAVSTYLDVTATVTGRSLGAAAADIETRLAEIDLPLDHHAEVLSDFQEASDTRFRVYTAAVAALILIYLLLQSAFGSWRLATLALLALPMGISGSLIVIALTGGTATLGSVAGTIAIFGLAARGVVLTIRTYQDRLRLGDTFGQDFVIGRTAHLIVPMTISAIAIAVVFLPLLISGSRPGLEIAGSMAVTVLGGLVTTVLLTVVVMPAVYLRWGYVEGALSSDDELFDDEPAVTPAGA